MYCRKCGKEIGATDAFCPQCGESVENRKGFAVPKVGERIFSGRLPENLSDRMYRLGDIKKFFYAAILAQLACVYFVGKEMISFEVSALYWDESMSISLFDDKKLILFLFRAGYVAAAAMMLLPLLSDKEWKTYDFFLGKCMPIAGVVWFAIVLLKGNDMLPDGSDYYGLVNITVNLKGEAWAFLGLSVAALLLTHKASKEISIMQYASQRAKEYERKLQRENTL